MLCASAYFCITQTMTSSKLFNANSKLSPEILSSMCLMKTASSFNCPHCWDGGIIFRWENYHVWIFLKLKTYIYAM